MPLVRPDSAIFWQDTRGIVADSSGSLIVFAGDRELPTPIACPPQFDGRIEWSSTL